MRARGSGPAADVGAGARRDADAGAWDGMRTWGVGQGAAGELHPDMTSRSGVSPSVIKNNPNYSQHILLNFCYY
jgi:hypothetical protein